MRNSAVGTTSLRRRGFARCIRSLASPLICSLVCSLVLLAPPARAQARSAPPALLKSGLVKVVAPRHYTPTELRARVRALANGAALLAKMDADQAGTGPGATSSVHPMVTTGGNASGIGSAGGTTTLTQNVASVDQNQWHVELNAYHTDFVNGSLYVVPGSDVHIDIAAPPGWSGPFTFLVLVDLAPLPGPLNASVTMQSTDGETMTCTGAQLRANLSGSVTSCALPVSRSDNRSAAERVTLSLPADVNMPFQLVDVSIMRVR